MWIKVSTILLCLSYVAAAEVATITTLADHMDFNVVSSQAVAATLKCIIDKGPCSDVAASFRQHYPDVIKEGCGRCSKAQRNTVRTFLNRAKNDFPELYQEYWKKWDPDGKYFDKFQLAISK